jgi:dTDP-4-amino-4,6-dideoxygalactose transaminase
MQVPLLDLKGQYATLRADVEQAIREVCDDQRFVLGPRVAALEHAVAEYSQALHGLGLSSGTDALLVALMALGVGHGDEVITTPFTFFATAGVIARLGARPLFCDIDPKTFNLDPVAVQTAIGSRCELRGGALVNRRTGGTVKAMIPVHLYGQMADLDALGGIAREHGLAVVEDAAQAIGAALADGRRAGAVGDVGCLSFFPTKNLGAFGDAGMCVTNDAALDARMRMLRVHGMEPKYYHAVIGGNFRLDELQAAVLLVKLEHLEAWTAARQRNADHYDALFADAALGETISIPYRTPGYRHVFNQYVVRAQRRDALRAYLAEHGVGSEVYYPLALHQQRCFDYLGGVELSFPNAERAAAEVLALPIYPELTEAQREYVVSQVAGFYRQ